MDTIYCLVDVDGQVYIKDGADSYADVAAAFGVNERECATYRYDLENRRLLPDRATPASATAARAYLERSVGTPENLIAFAAEGHLSKQSLAALLTQTSRQAFIAACAAVEKRYTEECTAKKDPCLEEGCASEGECCLEPLMRAGIEYQKACAAEWVTTFQDPKNRITAWAN
jgi:hypothetical protein